MIVWGGDDRVESFSDGAAYDPQHDRWRMLPEPPVAGRHWHSAVWTGSEMVVWGGKQGPFESNEALAYDPGTGTWSPLPEPPIGARHWAPFVWTGREALTWGGYDDGAGTGRSRAFGDGAAYQSGAWSTLPAATVTGRCGHTAVWSGTELIVWGGSEACGSYGHTRADGAAYSPSRSQSTSRRRVRSVPTTVRTPM